MPSEHALLAPSSAERWISCPASIRLSAEVPEQDSAYAHEGTLAHGLAELKALHAFERITPEEYAARYETWVSAAELSPEDLGDMHYYTDAFLALVKERVAEHPHSTVLFEQRVQTGIPKCWGTADVVIVSPTHVEIIDLKYGTGVAVSAVENPQLMLYGVGALETFGDVLEETETVRVTVCQPRLNSTSSYDILPADLRAWRDGLLPTAELALGDDAPFGPSEEACRFCPAKGLCRARLEAVVVLADFEQPDLLSPAELADAVRRLPELRAWATAVEEAALHRVYSEGVALPGLKVVLSGGQRRVVDQEAALDRLAEHGLERDALLAEPKLVGIGQLEKLLRLRYPGRGKAPKLEDVLGDALGRTEGRPSLVDEDDHRPAADPASEARKDFDVS